MTNIPPTPGFSRFHAIVAATPRDGYGPPVINTDYLRPSSYAPNTPSAPSRKRRRDSDGEDSSGPSAGNGQTEKRNIARKATAYDNIQQLLNALRDRFLQGPHVEFHGYCELNEDQNGVSHKQRVQLLTNDIWKSTGYRFTVKDHPRINDGHKTRFWCSQDDTHKNRLKASRNLQDPKPRLTSTGDVMAKTRYPCKSRLLISSRDAGGTGRRVITIRLGHHMNHEPYVDSTLMPDVVKTIWETFGWAGHRGNDPPLDRAHPTSLDGLNQSAGGNASAGSLQQEMGIREATPDEDSSEDEDERPDSPGILAGMTPGQMPPPNPPPPLQRDLYHQRMRSHIANIRDFCDGLDYQLQFDDTRMLEVVEREGQAFLKLVEECLRKEGRLVSAPEHFTPENPAGTPSNVSETISQGPFSPSR